MWTLLVLDALLWTHKVCFSCHLLAQDNAQTMQERQYQARVCVSVWTDIVRDIVWVPWVLPAVLPAVLDDLPLAGRRREFFYYDGAPVEDGEDARHLLSAKYSGRWVGCRAFPITV